jgi:hypothetical protein
MEDFNLEGLELDLDEIIVDDEGNISSANNDKESNKSQKETDPLILTKEELDTIEEDEEDETVEIKKDIETTDDNQSSEESEETEESIFSVFAKELKDANILSDIDDEHLTNIKSTEDLINIVSSQFDTWKNEYKNNLINNLIQEGLIEAKQVKNNAVINYSEEDIKKNIELQKDIIREYYSKKNIPTKKIEALIDSSIDTEEDAIIFNEELKAEKEKENLLIAQQLKQKEELANKQRQEFYEILKNNVYQVDEFIPGKKLKDKEKEEVLKNIQPTLLKINSNLPKYAPILALMEHYNLLDGKFDSITKVGESKAVDKLSQLLQNKKSVSANPKMNNKGLGLKDTDYKIYK